VKVLNGKDLFTPDLLKYVMALIAPKGDAKEVAWKPKREGFVYITGRICVQNGKDLFT